MVCKVAGPTNQLAWYEYKINFTLIMQSTGPHAGAINYTVLTNKNGVVYSSMCNLIHILTCMLYQCVIQFLSFVFQN